MTHKAWLSWRRKKVGREWTCSDFTDNKHFRHRWRSNHTINVQFLKSYIKKTGSIKKKLMSRVYEIILTNNILLTATGPTPFWWQSIQEIKWKGICKYIVDGLALEEYKNLFSSYILCKVGSGLAATELEDSSEVVSFQHRPTYNIFMFSRFFCTLQLNEAKNFSWFQNVLVYWRMGKRS